MAYENPVPLGEAGTGAAFLLPQSTALAGFDNYLDQRNYQQQQDAAARAAAARQTAAQWQKNRLDIKAGRLWQPEISARANQVMQTGMDLQRAGLDPTKYYNDRRQQKMVDDYNQQRQQVMNMAQVRDEYTKKLDENDKERSKQVDGYYESPDAEHQFMSTPLAQIMQNGYQVPDLKRTYDMQGAIDKLPTSSVKTKSVDPRTGIARELVLPNERAHADIAHSWLVNTPEAKAAAEKQIGMPLENIPSTSDVGKLKQQLDQHYRSMPAIPSLAAQGVKTFGLYGDNNSSGVPDANPTPPGGVQAPTSATNPEYDALLTRQATKLSQAKKKYDAIHANVVDQLNDKISRTNDQGYNFEYDREMRAREERGEGRIRFSQWLKEQQQDGGETTLGNAGGYVPVRIKQVSKADGTSYTDENGKVAPSQMSTQLEASGSIFTTKLPSVDVTVQPSTITNYDSNNGGTSVKNTGPISLKVSGIKMVPVLKGSNVELSARQLQDVISGKMTGKKAEDVTYKPMVYGIQDKTNEKGHKVPTPISIPYEDFKGPNTKKVNTSSFDKYYQQFQDLSKNPKFMALSPQDKAKFIAKYYQQQPPQ